MTSEPVTSHQPYSGNKTIPIVFKLLNFFSVYKALPTSNESISNNPKKSTTTSHHGQCCLSGGYPGDRAATLRPAAAAVGTFPGLNKLVGLKPHVGPLEIYQPELTHILVQFCLTHMLLSKNWDLTIWSATTCQKMAEGRPKKDQVGPFLSLKLATGWLLIEF